MANDINEIISSLTKIDHASSMIMESTRKEKETYANQIKQKTKQFDNELTANIDKKVSELKNSLIEENKTLIDECKKESTDSVAKLDSIYAANKDQWIDSIFKTIVKE